MVNTIREPCEEMWRLQENLLIKHSLRWSAKTYLVGRHHRQANKHTSSPATVSCPHFQSLGTGQVWWSPSSQIQGLCNLTWPLYHFQHPPIMSVLICHVDVITWSHDSIFFFKCMFLAIIDIYSTQESKRKEDKISITENDLRLYLIHSVNLHLMILIITSWFFYHHLWLLRASHVTPPPLPLLHTYPDQGYETLYAHAWPINPTSCCASLTSLSKHLPTISRPWNAHLVYHIVLNLFDCNPQSCFKPLAQPCYWYRLMHHQSITSHLFKAHRFLSWLLSNIWLLPILIHPSQSNLPLHSLLLFLQQVRWNPSLLIDLKRI